MRNYVDIFCKMNESKYYKARKKMPITEIYRLDLIIKKPTLVSPSPSEKYEKRMLAEIFDLPVKKYLQNV